jgi:hypothetical protein
VHDALVQLRAAAPHLLYGLPGHVMPGPLFIVSHEIFVGPEVIVHHATVATIVACAVLKVVVLVLKWGRQPHQMKAARRNRGACACVKPWENIHHVRGLDVVWIRITSFSELRQSLFHQSVKYCNYSLFNSNEIDLIFVH